MPRRVERAPKWSPSSSSNSENGSLLAALAAAARTQWVASGGLARAGRADEQRTGAAIEPAAQQRVQFGDASADRGPARTRCGARRRRGAGKTASPPRLDGVVVVAAAELDTAHLHHPQASSFRPVPVLRCSSVITPWAMLCSCRSRGSAVWSSSNSTVQPRLVKWCFSARTCRR